MTVTHTHTHTHTHCTHSHHAVRFLSLRSWKKPLTHGIWWITKSTIACTNRVTNTHTHTHTHTVPSWNKDQGLSLFCFCFHSPSELRKVPRCNFNDIYDRAHTHICLQLSAQTHMHACMKTCELAHTPTRSHAQACKGNTRTRRCNMHGGILNEDGKWCCSSQAFRGKEGDQDWLVTRSEGCEILLKSPDSWMKDENNWRWDEKSKCRGR